MTSPGDLTGLEDPRPFIRPDVRLPNPFPEFSCFVLLSRCPGSDRRPAISPWELFFGTLGALFFLLFFCNFLETPPFQNTLFSV